MFFKSTIATLFLLISVSISHSEMFVCEGSGGGLPKFKIFYDERHWENKPRYLTAVESDGEPVNPIKAVQVVVGAIEMEYFKGPLYITQLRSYGTGTRAYFFDLDNNIVSIRIDWWSGNPPTKENRPVKFEYYDRFLSRLRSNKIATGNCN